MSDTLGFACAWGPDPAETWSGTPFRLRAALRAGGALVDIPAELPKTVQLALKAMHTRRIDGRWVSLWKHGSVARALTERHLAAQTRKQPCDAVITIQDLGVLDVPYLVVQDLSYDVLLRQYPTGGIPHFPSLTRSDVERLRDRQLKVYDRAAALLPMSRWLGEQLEASGVPAAKIMPVHPGVNVPLPADAPVPLRRTGHASRLLLIGRDAHTKSLDLVLAAFAILRREQGAAVALTVAGPPHWPFPGAVPDGVSYLGPVTRDRVSELMDSHDLFVMPSRLEGFGIAFVEALSRGLPCIGRRAFAMPEIIEPGVGGALVDDDDPATLASLISKTLADDDLYQNCAGNAPVIRSYYTWERAAVDVRSAVSRAVG